MGGLGSLLPLLLLSGMGGMGVSPALIQNIQEEKKQSLEKWKSAIRLMVTLILGWVFAVSYTHLDVYKRQGVARQDSH